MKLFSRKLLIFFLFLLGEAVLTSTHNLYFGAKLRKIYTPLCYIKVGFKGVYISRTCFPDAKVGILRIVCLFELMINVPVNINGHVGMCLHFMGLLPK